MDVSRTPLKNVKSYIATTVLGSLLVAASHIGIAQATSLSDLQQQQNALEQQAQQAQAQAKANETIAQRAADKITEVSSQIGQLSSQIQTTTSTISDTQSQIDQQDQQLGQFQTQLSELTNQENALVRSLYIAKVSYPNDLLLFSNKDIGTQAEIQKNMTALGKSVTEIYNKTNDAKQQVADAREQLIRKNDALKIYQGQQQDQQQSLADFKTTQVQLKTNAVATEQQLETQAAQAQAKANQISQKIQLLSRTTNWGSQIVSSDDASWYYTQTGDPTRLGSSSETVNNVGCLITSIAMVATFYGRHITPDFMARNAGFSGGGSYYWGTPSGLGISLQPSGGVNWGTVQGQIEAGHPVIVSIYLPSIGAVNSDGSSHYVVIKGQADGKYLMQDPIGHGRSYNLNQVRSMILTHSN